MFSLCLVQDNVTMQETGKRGDVMNCTEYKNQFYEEHYDRINLAIPKGEKERISLLRLQITSIGSGIEETLDFTVIFGAFVLGSVLLFQYFFCFNSLYQ